MQQRLDTLRQSISNFALHPDPVKASCNMLLAITQNYKFDLGRTFFYDRAHQVFSPLCTTNQQGPVSCNSQPNHAAENLADGANYYNIHIATHHEQREKEITSIFNQAHFVRLSTAEDIANATKILGIDCDSDAKELIIYGLFDDNLTIGMAVLQKNTLNDINEQDLKDILTILDVFNARARDRDRTREFEKKYTLEKSVADTAGFDRKLLVVDVETYEVLYHDNCLPELEDDGIIHKLLETDETEGEAYQVIPEFMRIGELARYGDYIVRTKDISWQNSNDALMVSLINTSQFSKDNLVRDRLTGVYTWFGLKEKLQREKEVTRGRKFAYISIDIEKLKIINAENSREVGDEILQKVCVAMRAFVNANEYYCRVVSDTFAVLINYENDETLKNRVDVLGKDLAKMFRTVLPNKSIVATGGVYVLQDGDLLDQLEQGFENSKIARNTIKGSYQNGFALFTDDLKMVLTNSQRIEDKVSAAIDNNEFSVYLQPKFSLKTREIVGAEALVRWISKTETIYPDNFIPVFEKNGFVRKLDFIVYEKVFQFIRQCLDKKIDIVPISINMSRNHLEDEDFLEKLISLITDYDIPRHLVVVEITENASAHSDHKLCSVVEKIKKENISVSMDDFGAAYSSLSLLKELEIDTLKLDKEFLPKMSREKSNTLTKDEIIIKNIVYMAKELEFKVICEGIETEAQLEFLASVGCDNGQGYLFSKPLPTDEFLEKMILKHN